MDVRSGCDYKNLSEGTIPVYGTGGYMLSVDKALSYTEDAVGIRRKGTIDKPYILRAPFWTVDTLFYAVPRHKYDLQFVLGIFLKIDWKKKDESTGVPSLSKQTINTVDIMVPENQEQQKIGVFFQSLDRLITLHQRVFFRERVAQTINDHKKTDSWEQRKLGDISEKIIEKNAARLFSETFTNSAENGIISQQDYFDHAISNEANLNGYYVVRAEDFVYNPRISVTAPVGPINRNKLRRTGVMSPLYTVFRPHDIDNTFFEYFFKSNYWHPYMEFNGDTGARSDRFAIKDSVFFEMPIPYPAGKEQQKIGTLFRALDDLITLHQREYLLFEVLLC
ncbi:MAG: restriction endonuclease subunit S [Bacillota bacterium]